MKRRTYLTATGCLAVVGLAGCIAGQATDDDEPTAFAIDTDEVPDERALHHDVTLVTSELRSEEAPLSLQVKLSNEMNEPVEFGERRATLFWDKYDEGYRLLPHDVDGEDAYEFDEDDRRWVATDVFPRTGDFQTEVVPAGEELQQELVLIAVDDELSGTPDALAFETEFWAMPEDETSGVDYEQTETWGFVLKASE